MKSVDELGSEHHVQTQINEHSCLGLVNKGTFGFGNSMSVRFPCASLSSGFTSVVGVGLSILSRSLVLSLSGLSAHKNGLHSNIKCTIGSFPLTPTVCFTIPDYE